jgi:hypothetical protein
MRQLNDNVLPTQAAATINSSAILSLNMFYASAQIVCTGAAAGTLVIQASNDDLTTTPASNQLPVNWSNIPSATVTVTGAGVYLIPKFDLCYQYIRASYTNTGSGTISVVIKTLGA